MNAKERAYRDWKQAGSSSTCAICKKDFKECPHAIVQVEKILFERYIKEIVREETFWYKK